ncbi:MAG: hypothetical protein FWB91_12595 [Defluviitaleaceae bacterium]|nr:hypothetical protein [Defluviitaleaceae bacterium]
MTPKTDPEIELALVKTELLREKAKINLKRGGKPLPKTTKLHPKDVVNPK